MHTEEGALIPGARIRLCCPAAGSQHEISTGDRHQEESRGTARGRDLFKVQFYCYF